MRSIHQFELDHSRSSHASLIRVGLSNTGTGLAKRHPKTQIESTQRRTSLRRPHPVGKVGMRIPETRPQQRRLHRNTGEYTSNDLVYLRARHYVTSIGRFLTKDTWEGNYNRPLSFNRWMYVEGNPANYIDPSGHFTDSAIKSYLTNTYKRDWELYWNAWSADIKWMNMLHKAVAGNVLFGEHWTVRFEGVGKDVLWGISSSDFMQPIDLNDIFKGEYHETYITAPPIYREPPAYGGTGFNKRYWTDTVFYPIKWVSFYGTDERGMPCFYVYPGLEYKETQQESSFAVDSFDYAVGTLAGLIAGGAPGAVAGYLFSVALKPSDVLNVQMNDRIVQIGPVRFNFQLQSDTDTWILEDGPY